MPRPALLEVPFSGAISPLRENYVRSRRRLQEARISSVGFYVAGCKQNKVGDLANLYADPVLQAENYCLRFRTAAREAQDSGLGTSDIGFGAVLNPK